MDIANKTWKIDEIFQDIPGDANNVNMVIPQEIAEYLELNEGDTIRIQVTESGIVIEKAT
jgi:AbrB family looped-hinge helix DNA binding protein